MRLSGQNSGFKQVAQKLQSFVLRREPLERPPAFGVSAVAKPIVQAIRPALPELDALRNDAITAPELRGGHIVGFGILLVQLLPLAIKRLAAGQNLALMRGPSTQAAALRSASKIRLRLLAWHTLHRAFDAHLPRQLRPIKRQRCER